MTGSTTDPSEELPTFERFEVVKCLGKGGMGVVYEAVDRESGSRVALKTLRRVAPEDVIRLKAEFRALRDLRHPNLVRLGELGEEGGSWYFTMELVEGLGFRQYVGGESLRQDSASWSSIATTGPSRQGSSTASPARAGDPTVVDGPPTVVEGAAPRPSAGRPSPDPPVRPAADEGRLRAALRELALGLAALHRAGKVHRDVKPSNIMVDRAGRVVLLDFGVVAELAGGADWDEAKLVGTVPYMAPEQGRGEKVGPAADWYAVGAVLYEALTGTAPHGRGSAGDVILRKCTFDPTPPRQVVPDAPEDLSRLAMLLLARDPALRPSGEQVLRVLGVDDVTDWLAFAPAALDSAEVFVGREVELRALEAALDRAGKGELVGVLLLGESGVGKSALARELLRWGRAADPDLVVLSGRCHERERVPYNAFDGVVDELARELARFGGAKVARLLPRRISPLLALFPALRAVPAVSSAAEAEIDGRPGGDPRVEGFAALTTILRRLARRRPLAVVVDDLQWADADSRALLRELAAAARPPPLFFLATARPVDGGPPPAAADLGDALAVHEIGGLAAEDAEDLTRKLASLIPGAPAQGLAEIAQEAAGHPLFIAELLRAAADRGSVGRLDDAIWGRAQGLDPRARELLAVVAVSGFGAPHRAVAAAAGLRAEEYAKRLEVLQDEKLVRITGGRLVDRAEPFHDRVREAIYGRLDAETRARLHLALGEALELEGAPPEQLVAHFAAAGASDRAARHAEAAAARAASALAFERAAELYRVALAGPRDPADRGRLLEALAEALDDAGRARDSALAYRDAALAAEDPEARRDLERRAAGQLLVGGYVDEGLELVSASLAAVGLRLPGRKETVARLLVAQLRLSRHPLTWRSQPCGELDPSKVALVDTCWTASAGLTLVDSLTSAYFAALCALGSLELGHPLRIARALSQSAMTAGAMGHRPRVERLLAAAERAAEEDGSLLAQYYLERARAGVAFTLDQDFHACFERCGRVEELWRGAGRGRGWAADTVSHIECASLVLTGPLPELRRRVREELRAARRTGNRYLEVTFRVRFIYEHLMADDPDRGEAEVEGALSEWAPETTIFGNQRLWALISRTRLCLYRGDAPARRDELLAGWRQLRGTLVSRVPLLQLEWAHVYGGLWLALAADARRRGREAEAQGHLRRAEGWARKLDGLPFGLGALLAAALRAGAAAARGDRDAELALLEEARAGFAERALWPYEAICARVLGARLGDGAGEELVRRADRWLEDNDVRSPARLAAMFLPGWPHPG